MISANKSFQFSLSTVPGCFRFVYARDPSVIDVAVIRLAGALAKLEKRPVVSPNMQPQSEGQNRLSQFSTTSTMIGTVAAEKVDEEPEVQSQQRLRYRLLRRVFCN